MESSKSGKCVLILCGDYMEDYEVMVPFQALLAYGVCVDAACPGKKVAQMLILGYYLSTKHASSLGFVFKEKEDLQISPTVAGKPVASICHGQLILAAVGLVKGSRDDG